LFAKDKETSSPLFTR